MEKHLDHQLSAILAELDSGEYIPAFVSTYRLITSILSRNQVARIYDFDLGSLMQAQRNISIV